MNQKIVVFLVTFLLCAIVGAPMMYAAKHLSLNMFVIPSFFGSVIIGVVVTKIRNYGEGAKQVGVLSLFNFCATISLAYVTLLFKIYLF